MQLGTSLCVLSPQPNLKHLNSIYAVTMHHIQSLKKSVQSETHCCKWFSKSKVISPLWLSLDRSCLQQCQQGQKQNTDCQHKTLKIRWRKRMKCMKPYMPDFPVQIPVKIKAKSWGDFSRFRIDSNLAASVCLQPVTCVFSRTMLKLKSTSLMFQ